MAPIRRLFTPPAEPRLTEPAISVRLMGAGTSSAHNGDMRGSSIAALGPTTAPAQCSAYGSVSSKPTWRTPGLGWSVGAKDRTSLLSMATSAAEPS